MLKQPALPVLLGSFESKEVSGPDAWHCDRLQALGSSRRSLSGQAAQGVLVLLQNWP